MTQSPLLIPHSKMQNCLHSLFVKNGFADDKALLLAEVFTETTMDGIQSHGLNRVPMFIDYIQKGVVDVKTEAIFNGGFGSIERWDGQHGPGIINALKCTDRALTLAHENGMGLVALRNTNHWLRGGTYGWRVAEAGCIGILFTNTIPNMPAWGGKEKRLGNNPLVISIPRPGGHVVLDMAMTQFSFGKMHQYSLKGEKLPYLGGWNKDNELTDDPTEILSTGRGLPIGYWKGSALSMVLDMLATLLSAGKSTYNIGQKVIETDLSQIYLTIDPNRFGDKDLSANLLQEIIDFSHDTEPIEPNGRTYYPGERTLENRKLNKERGIPVDPTIWNEVLSL